MQNKVHIGDYVSEELNNQERSMIWLSKQIECDRSNLRKMILSGKLNQDKLIKISKVLGKDFVQIFKQLAKEKLN